MNPCAGFNDGEILIAIPVLSDGELFEVYLNDVLQTTSSSENILQFGGLPGNVNHEFEIIIGDCHFEFTVRLPEGSLQKSLGN